jgi:predicted dehydrogenase
MDKVKFGILSTAKIGREKVIPAIQASKYCEVYGIASRQKDAADKIAKELQIPRAYSSYEELLNDPTIMAVYIPLPNDMHVEWSIKALQAGKHVLCEKPIGLSSSEAQKLIDVAAEHPGLKVMEAFMYRFHPQWKKAKQMVLEEKIGKLRTVHSFFSYYNTDPANIRNQRNKGGGALMDIGCYCISLSRFLFGEEPEKVFGVAEFDPISGVDFLASGILQFTHGTSTFTCSTQLSPYQRVQIFGTTGSIEIEIPFNAPLSGTTTMWERANGKVETIIIDPVNQYTLQADMFAKSILGNTDVPTPLSDAIDNMKVIEAIFKSSGEGAWVTPHH